MVHHQVVGQNTGALQLRLQELTEASNACLGDDGRLAPQLRNVNGDIRR